MLNIIRVPLGLRKSKPGPAFNRTGNTNNNTKLLEGAEEVTHYCRLLHAPSSMGRQDANLNLKPLSESQRLHKVILELVETERQYFKDLNCLIDRYLEPLREEPYLSGEDVQHLFGNIQEIVQFQRLFLHSLEEAIEMEPNFLTKQEPRNYRRILFSIGGSFLYYANHFKLYSSFCASHSKAQRMLNPEKNPPLQEFLRARNPKGQHSATLESYLIKPIQRILKYPLLLAQLKSLTDPQSDEHNHLSEALKGMEAVAGHINEMQKIYEEYGAIFDDLIRQHRESQPNKPVDLNVGELQMYGHVKWLNVSDGLGKPKVKSTDLISTLFLFKTGVVLLAMEKLKSKRRSKPPTGKPPLPPMEATEIVRYQTIIPVDQLHVRVHPASESDKAGLWEIIHCKSETEGRPERVFQLASSLSARGDFLKTIRNIIRESVRKMSLPSNRQSRTKPPLIPSAPRPETIIAAAHGTIGRKKCKELCKQEANRHSMEIEDNHSVASSGSDNFRTRSQTLGDLKNLEGLEAQRQNSSGSQSTIGSGSQTGSAKLLHSSNNPVNYSSTNVHKDSLGSPVWKPRHSPGKVPPQAPSPSKDDKRLEATVFGGQAYGDYSNIMYDEKQGAIMMAPPNTMYFEYEDTEC